MLGIYQQPGQMPLAQVLSCDSEDIMTLQIYRAQSHGLRQQIPCQTKLRYFTSFPPEWCSGKSKIS